MSKTNIELAREAGINEWWDSGNEQHEVLTQCIDRYTTLVEARLMAKLLEGAGESVNRDDTVHGVNYYTSDQIAAAVLRERERILACYSPDDTANDWADKIRGTK